MPTRIIQISTSTGTFPSTGGWVDLAGGAYRYAAYADDRTETDKDIKGTVQGTIGGSPKWATVVTLTTDSTGTIFTTTGTDPQLFDKLRVVIETNNSTEAFQAWVAAGD